VAGKKGEQKKGASIILVYMREGRSKRQKVNMAKKMGTLKQTCEKEKGEKHWK